MPRDDKRPKSIPSEISWPRFFFLLAFGLICSLLPVKASAIPICDAGPDKSVFVGEVVAFNGSCEAPGGEEIISFLWNFGDGSTNNSGPDVNHAYFSEGEFTATFSCTDESGSTCSDILIVEVLPAVEVCGNGNLEGSEECDDGNTDDGDCCSSSCEFETAGSACGSNSDTECDNPDTCDGGGICQVNNESNGTFCGDSGTECTNQDTCSAGSCIDNGFQLSGTGCGSSSDTECDNPDTCDGGGICQVNNEADGTNCGDAEIECAKQDTCGGGACQDSGVQPSGFECRPGAGDCDVAETCDGQNASCPPDAVEPSSTVCRGSAGLCDIVENCDGENPDCPADAVEPVDTVCRTGSGDVCDPSEVCDGSNPECPENFFEDNTSLCQLDPENFCPGVAGEECPVFRFASKIFPNDNLGCTHEAVNLGADKIVDIDITAICVSGGVGEHTDTADKCICIGPRSNGFNATSTSPNGTCARSQTGPFCFVDNEAGPLFWKEQLSDTCESVFVAEEGREACEFDCPPGKMAISCFGDVRQVSNPD